MQKAKTIILYTVIILTTIILSFYIYGFIQYWMGSVLTQVTQKYHQFILALPFFYFATYFLCKSSFHKTTTIVYIITFLIFNILNITLNLGFGPIIKIDNLPLYVLSIITLVFGIVQILQHKNDKIMISFSVVKILQSLMLIFIIGIIMLPIFIIVELPLLFVIIYRNAIINKEMRPTTAST